MIHEQLGSSAFVQIGRNFQEQADSAQFGDQLQKFIPGPRIGSEGSRIMEVIITEFCFSTPRIIMHRCLASQSHRHRPPL